MSNDLSEIDMLLDKDALALAERRALWAKHRAEILPLVRAFVKINATLRFPDSLDVSLSGDKHTLAEAVRALRTNGFRTLNKPPDVKVWTDDDEIAFAKWQAEWIASLWQEFAEAERDRFDEFCRDKFEEECL